jgi:hypothetical protein
MKKMQRLMVGMCGILFILSAGQATASQRFSQNEFMTAESLDPGMTQAGVNFTLGDHYRSYYPEIRYGLGALMEVGVKFGATSARVSDEDKIGALVGVDLKYQLIKEAEGIPIDLSVDLAFDNTIISSRNASELTFSTIVSKGFPLTERGYKLIPYGGLSMSSLNGSLPDRSGTALYVFGGLRWKLTQKFMAHLEVKTGDSTMGGVGISFEY